jgi:lipopolysaccharide/colanic/teichoic acid biosynthesis glycosyltransferase
MLKRAADLLLALIGLALLWPLLLLLALWVRLDSPGPALFRQERVGRGGRPFQILKFRTMADRPGEGRQITVGADPRITRSGRLLRAAKLDELPQLINVLLGEMSFVGPRPEVPRYVALYTLEERRVLELRPGITDLASVKYRREAELLAASPDPERTYVEQVMRDKLRINLDYAARAGLLADLAVILRTLGVLFGLGGREDSGRSEERP